MRYYIIAAGLYMLAVGAHAQEAATLPQGARAAGVPVGGLTPGQARQRLARALQKKLSAPVIVTDGVKTRKLPRRQLGVGLDVEAMVGQVKQNGAAPLRFQVDRPVMQRALRQIAPQFAFPGRDAAVTEFAGHVVTKPGLHRRTVDVATSTQNMAHRLSVDPAARTLRLTVNKKPPRVTAADLKGITGRLGRFVTRFNAGDEKRTHNIRLAVSFIHGTVLPPGKVFSMNQAVGKRTQARGYLTAHVIEYGQLVPGIGGGVSQVTGTLFNAALVAGLPIVEYRTHTRPVKYLPVGRDATLAWEQFDMKFKNNTHAPIYIAYRVVGNRAVATLYGAKTPGQKVKVAVHARRLGPRRIQAELYRTIVRNGRVRSKERVGQSHYEWKPDRPA